MTNENQSLHKVAGCLGWALLTLLAFYTTQSLVAAIAQQWLNDTKSSPDVFNVWVTSLSVLVSGLVGIVLTTLIATKHERSLKFRLTLSKSNILLLLIFSLSAIALSVSFVVISQFAGWQGGDAMADFITIGASSVLAWIAVVIIAPLFEELLFRGYMFKALKGTSVGTLGAIFIPNTLWMFIHMGQYAAFGLLFIFAAGLLFSWARWKTDSLVTPIIMHMAFNATTLLVHLF